MVPGHVKHQQHVVALDARDLGRDGERGTLERDLGPGLVADGDVLYAALDLDVDERIGLDLADRVDDLLADLDQARDGQVGDGLIIGRHVWGRLRRREKRWGSRRHRRRIRARC